MTLEPVPEHAVLAELEGWHVLTADERTLGRIRRVLVGDDGIELEVHSGWWIFADQVLIPAAAVEKVFDHERAVLVACTQAEIEHHHAGCTNERWYTTAAGWPWRTFRSRAHGQERGDDAP